MHFTLESCLSVPLCLILLVSVLLCLVPLDANFRGRTQRVMVALAEKVQAAKEDEELLFKEVMSSQELKYLQASGQHTVEFLACFVDLQGILED